MFVFVLVIVFVFVHSRLYRGCLVMGHLAIVMVIVGDCGEGEGQVAPHDQR